MDHGFLTRVKKFVGTSIGAILCYLLCIGYSPVELMVLLCQNNWLGKLGHFDFYNIVHGSGAISFSIVHEILEKLTVQKIGRFMTLKQLEDEYGKTLVCCAFNYTLDKEEFMDPTNHPDLPCLTALRMSANLPLVFEPFLYNGAVYLDGGLSSNFPLHYCKAEDRVLGVALFPTAPSEAGKLPSAMELLWKTMTIPMSLLQTLRTQQDALVSDKRDIVEVRVDGYFCLQFDIGNSEKFDMFSTGYNTAKEFYDRGGKSVRENTSGGDDDPDDDPDDADDADVVD